MPADPTDPPRRFEFERDSFDFANELRWEYGVDAGTGNLTHRRRQPQPEYTHRCFVLVRAARQFLYHARFDPLQERADEARYRQQVRRVMARNPRRRCAPADQIVFPGFGSLRQFSASHANVLKAECGGAWRSYVLRSHWRMVLPISRAHQQRTAAGLAAALEADRCPLVHLVRFPALTINHGMIVFAAAARPHGWEFTAYDPNDPARPARLDYDQAARGFSLSANSYWAGGPLNLIEIYRNWFL